MSFLKEWLCDAENPQEASHLEHACLQSPHLGPGARLEAARPARRRGRTLDRRGRRLRPAGRADRALADRPRRRRPHGPGPARARSGVRGRAGRPGADQGPLGRSDREPEPDPDRDPGRRRLHGHLDRAVPEQRREHGQLRDRGGRGRLREDHLDRRLAGQPARRRRDPEHGHPARRRRARGADRRPEREPAQRRAGQRRRLRPEHRRGAPLRQHRRRRLRDLRHPAARRLHGEPGARRLRRRGRRSDARHDGHDHRRQHHRRALHPRPGGPGDGAVRDHDGRHDAGRPVRAVGLVVQQRHAVGDQPLLPAEHRRRRDHDPAGALPLLRQHAGQLRRQLQRLGRQVHRGAAAGGRLPPHRHGRARSHLDHERDQRLEQRRSRCRGWTSGSPTRARR